MDYQSQLHAYDEKRNAIRALASDQYLEDRLEQAKSTNSSLVEALQKAVDNRKSRREMEKSLRMKPIPPGPWDDDLDLYHDEKGYEFEIEGGYKGRLSRNLGMSWNGYVTLPEGHPARGKHYDWFVYDSPKQVPRPPQELTYGDGTTFGFDHLHGSDTIPSNMLRAYTYKNYYNGTNLLKEKPYLTFEDVKKEVIELANYFKEIGEMTGYPSTSPKIRAPFQEPVPKSPLSSPKAILLPKNSLSTIPKNSKVSWAQVVTKK